jgi:hypothetical protein
MLSDITLIVSLLAVVVGLSQLRFSRLHIAKTLLWLFLILMATILILQVSRSEWFYQNKTFLDSLFWVSFVGMLVAYIWIKKVANVKR